MAPPTDLGLERRADSSVAALVVGHMRYPQKVCK